MLHRFPKKWFSLLLLLPLITKAQDITGLWKGTLYNDSTGKTLRYEIGISQEKGKLKGFSHTFFIIDDKQYFGLKRIKLKKKGNTIIIEDDGLLTDNYPVRPPKGVHQLSVLELDMADSVMVLSGPFTTTRTREYHSLTGKVYLQRKNDFRQSALVPHLTELGLANEIDFAPTLTDPAIAILLPAGPETPIASVNRIPATLRIDSALVAGKLPRDVTIPEPEMPLIPRPNNQAASTTNAAPAATTNTQGALPAGKKPIAVTLPKPVMPAPDKPAAAVPAAKTVAITPKPIIPAPDRPVPTAPAVKTAAAEPVAIVAKKDIPLPVNTAPLVSNDLPAIGNERRVETVQTLFFNTDSLELTLYDNGEVDGDTVSVYLNGRLIMPNQGLSTKAIKKTIRIPPGTDSIQLVMYAVSMGSIPPNTGLLVVHDGEAIYEVRFSADMKKNAAILFRRQPR